MQKLEKSKCDILSNFKHCANVAFALLRNNCTKVQGKKELFDMINILAMDPDGTEKAMKNENNVSDLRECCFITKLPNDLNQIVKLK